MSTTSKQWTQLSWSNEQKVLNRTLITVVNELNAWYTNNNHDDEFQSSWKEMERRGEAANRATRKSLAGFKLDVKAIKTKQTGTVDPASIAVLLENFESKLSSYKSSMRKDFDMLVDAFATTEEDLRQCLERSTITGVGASCGVTSQGDDSFDSGNSSLQQKKARKQELDKNLQMQTQVGLIDRQILELGGRYGKWDPRDHDVFMRIWNQNPVVSKTSHPKRSTVCKKLVTLLSDKTDVECEEHYNWFILYNELLEKKKKILHEWRGSSQSEKEKEMKAILGNERGDQDGNNSSGEFARGQLQRQPRRHSEAEAQSMREQIERWRKQKEEEEAATTLREREEEIRERQRRHEKDRKRQQESRLQIERWRSEEAAIKQMEQLEITQGGKLSPRRERARVLDAEQNAARDLEFAIKRRQERESKQKKDRARETRLKDLEGKLSTVPAAPRDPKRLLADTVATGLSKKTIEQLDEAERRRSSGGAHSSNMAYTARDLNGMRRATPVWIAKH